MGPLIIRLFVRVIVVLIVYAIVRRSMLMVGTNTQPGSRGSLLPWLGLALGVVLAFSVLRGCGLRL